MLIICVCLCARIVLVILQWQSSALLSLLKSVRLSSYCANGGGEERGLVARSMCRNVFASSVLWLRYTKTETDLVIVVVVVCPSRCWFSLASSHCFFFARSVYLIRVNASHRFSISPTVLHLARLHLSKSSPSCSIEPWESHALRFVLAYMFCALHTFATIDFTIRFLLVDLCLQHYSAINDTTRQPLDTKEKYR